MTSLIKNQILKHLTKFFKDLVPEQLQFSAFKGSCELSNLQLEEKVLMDLLSFPAWIRINKATCDQIAIKIPWTKIKSVPIQMNLNEVLVEVEICEDFRDICDDSDESNLANIINSQAPAGKYGFVDRVIDGITVTVNSVLITFKSKLMSATFNLSRVILESRCPNWRPGELSLTRIKDVTRGQILLFKIVEWQTMRLEAKCLTDPQQAPLRLITNHAQCRLTIKKQLDDCSVVAARIFVIFEDILWVLTFAQFISAASFVEYVFTLIKRSPVSKKSTLLDDQSNSSMSSSSFNLAQSAPLMSPLGTPVHRNQMTDKPLLLTGNMSSASLTEQKFLCYDLLETSMHLYIDKVDAHLYDDLEISSSAAQSSNRESGGALQTTLDQIQIDCYPYSRATSDRKHWYKWFDPSPSSRKQWQNSHFAEFDMAQMHKRRSASRTSSLVPESNNAPASGDKLHIPKVANDQLLSLTVLIKVKDYCMNCVATRHSGRSASLNKFIQTDKDYQMPSDMPSLYLELDYFYYFDAVNRMMIYDNVPDPLAFMHLSPTRLLFDPPTLLFLHSFQVNLSKALVHLNDLLPEDTSAPKVHCRIEILMPQISLPAKQRDDQPPNANTSHLLAKSGKITLSNSIYDKHVLSKLMESIDKLKESPNKPINIGGYDSNSKDNSLTGDWTKVWNASLINRISDFNMQNQLWVIQFEPVWMDFMNYDVDPDAPELSNRQRLEPIIEPFDALAFIHLNLSSTVSTAPNDATGNERQREMNKRRDVLSILFSVMDKSVLANMDKVQFGFLQRLGMHIEKLLQQIRADAQSVIQLDTVIEDTLELNLTAYIKDIKARLILERKIQMQTVETSADGSCSLSNSVRLNKLNDVNILPELSVCTKASTSISSDKPSPPKPKIDILIPEVVSMPPRSSSNQNLSAKNDGSILLNPFELTTNSANVSEIGFDGNSKMLVFVPGESMDGELDNLDECAEVADDASCLLMTADESSSLPSSSPTEKLTPGNNNNNINLCNASLKSVDSKTSANADATELPKSSILSDNLLLDLEQSSSIFAKVDLNNQTSHVSSGKTTVDAHDAHDEQQPRKVSVAMTNSNTSQLQQEIETENISYLELSMSQLMVRRITETKRRQKF